MSNHELTRATHDQRWYIFYQFSYSAARLKTCILCMKELTAGDLGRL